MPVTINGSGLASGVTSVPNLQSFPIGPRLDGANMPVGSVLQVVNATYATQVSVNSGTATTGLTTSITPKFATSKILVLVSQNFYLAFSGGANLYGYFSLQRNSTAIYTGQTAELQLNNAIQYGGRWCVNISDSPATTSSTSYTVYYTEQSGNATFQNGGTTSFITLMEVAA